MFYCPKCSAKVSVKARSCEKCGYILSKETSTPLPASPRGPGLIRPVGITPTPIHAPNPAKPPQFMRPAFLPSKGQTKHNPIEVVKGRPALIEADEQFDQFEDGAESYIATSVAAEHWRTSWRNRQRSEAGPAADVSRGHADVPEPLLAMQGAMIGPKDDKESASPGLWLAIFLVVCLIGGLAVYIASTFVPIYH